MIVKSRFRGHLIEHNGTEWVYSDTKEATAGKWQERNCGHCGLFSTPEGHDGCLGTLPNVKNACCGHGDSNTAYVQFDKQTTLRGKEAIEKIKELKGESE